MDGSTSIAKDFRPARHLHLGCVKLGCVKLGRVKFGRVVEVLLVRSRSAVNLKNLLEMQVSEL